jgi:hypothetical protein
MFLRPAAQGRQDRISTCTARSGVFHLCRPRVKGVYSRERLFSHQGNSSWVGIKLLPTQLLLVAVSPQSRNVQAPPGLAIPGAIKRASAAYFGQPIQEYCHATETF